MVLCACGCGKEIANKKAKRGGRFFNQKHAARWRGMMRKGTHLGPYRNVSGDRSVDYSKGKEYCKDYDNEDIICVMCYENNRYEHCAKQRRNYEELPDMQEP